MPIYELEKLGSNIPKLKSAESLLYGDGSQNEVIQMSLRDLHPSPINRRVDKQSPDYKELYESIQASGINTPLMVRKIDSGFEILSGHHRYEIAKDLGFKEVPVIIRNASDDEAAVIIYESNIRVAVRITDKAAAYKHMMDAYKRMERDKENVGVRTVDLMAEQMDVSRATIQRLIRINDLIPQLKDKIDDGSLNLKQGVNISYLDYPSQEEVYTAIEQGHKISSKAAEKLRSCFEEKQHVTQSDIKDIIESEKAARKSKAKASDRSFSSAVRKFFTDESDDEIEKIIVKLLKEWRSSK